MYSFYINNRQKYSTKQKQTLNEKNNVKQPINQSQSKLPHSDGYFSIFGSIIQGAALGTGSELAGRAIDSLIGPKKIEINNKSDKCINENEKYLKCISANNDISLCKEYFEILNKCKNNII